MKAASLKNVAYSCLCKTHKVYQNTCSNIDNFNKVEHNEIKLKYGATNLFMPSFTKWECLKRHFFFLLRLDFKFIHHNFQQKMCDNNYYKQHKVIVTSLNQILFYDFKNINISIKKYSKVKYSGSTFLYVGSPDQLFSHD